MRFVSIFVACVLCSTHASAQQARKWVEPDGRVTYSDVQPSKNARLAGSVKDDSQPAGAGEKIEAGKVELVEGQVSVTGADSKPQVLASIPAAFRVPANDSRMQGRHDRVQPGLGEKRAQAQ